MVSNIKYHILTIKQYKFSKVTNFKHSFLIDLIKIKYYMYYIEKNNKAAVYIIMLACYYKEIICLHNHTLKTKTGKQFLIYLN